MIATSTFPSLFFNAFEFISPFYSIFADTHASYRYWYGDRCQYMCPWDNEKRHCSDNGVCVYDPSVQELPYCKCNAYYTRNPNQFLADQALAECQEQQIQIQDNGWCSYYDATVGFAACFEDGMCGVCEDKQGGAHRSRSIVLTLTLMCAFSVASWS